MISPEVERRFLRPLELEDNLENNWHDDQHVWVLTNGQYTLARVIQRKEDKIEVYLGDGQIIEVSLSEVSNVNAHRFEKCEDMAEMSELNEAAVLHNLKQRYNSNFIYTYSGLFLVALNPYKAFPIYTPQVVDYFRGQRRCDRPPHVFSIADSAYRSMIESRQNQSILITGESGAGKTENTKRVIQYLAQIAGEHNAHESCNLEEQIIKANPILESFGNAQTVRNNNSSRFGKFVRIEFNKTGVICGGNIEKYLLEKSRVTHRSQKERSFHIFYQLLRGATPEIKEKLHLNGDCSNYAYLKYSNQEVDEIDDKRDFASLLSSMEVLGFTENEKMQFFLIVAIVLHLGNLEIAEDENGQAQVCNIEVAKTICELLGISLNEFLSGLLKPVIKAGRDEVVSQARDMSQVIFSIEALSRSLYDRMFTKLVQRVNSVIDRMGSSKGNFIGVLDIAGFEIFEKNSFEQLCINHTNEKLQQFFNHHMFVTEQEEYKREGIEWNYIDFGLDLQPTIDLIEKSNPIGLLACLDEDCVVPKATDKSFCEKMTNLWKGKSGKFEATRFGDGFFLQHYAGKVEYSTDGWLVKNKDPLNDNVTRLLARSENNFVASMFQEYFGNDEEVYQANKGAKKGLFRTVAQKHRESLALLMQTLYSTQPHFVRCIIPNESKQPDVVNDGLVLEQLRCNGVLEGIRICRLGYPNRLPYPIFVRLYEILADTTAKGSAKEKTIQLLQNFGLSDGEHYRLGNSKVFLRTGEIGKLDERRDRRLSQGLKTIQAIFRRNLAIRAKYKETLVEESTTLLQRNIRLYLQMRQWAWWKLYLRIKPLLNFTRAENKISELEEELKRLSLDRDAKVDNLTQELNKERDMLFEMETRRRDLERENQQLSVQISEANESKAALVERKFALELEVSRLKEKISTELEGQKELLEEKVKQYEQAGVEMKKQIEDLKVTVSKLKLKLEESEFERMKFEKTEATTRERLQEAECVIEDVKRAKKDLEFKVKQLEEGKRALQEQLDDEAADLAKRRQLEAEYEVQLKNVKQQYEETFAEKEEEWEGLKRKMQREMHQLVFDLDQEKKQSASLKETIKRYESGADNLATQLEAELRNQNSWKREKDRMELRLKEITRQHQEAVEREDSLQALLSNQYEIVREIRGKAADCEESLLASERQRKAIEARYESLAEQHRELLSGKQVMERQCAALEINITEITNKLHDLQDKNDTLQEKLKAAEYSSKAALGELEEERKQREYLTQEKAVLEMQIKELQIKMLEFESNYNGVASRAPIRRPSGTLNQVLAAIESESNEKQALLKENRRQERALRELQSQLAERDRSRISLEESLDKSEIKMRKLQTAMETLEARNSELELTRRRLERDLEDEREKGERLTRECGRLRSKAALRASCESMAAAQCEN